MRLGGTVVNYKSMHNESDSQTMSKEINILKERLNMLKKEKITTKNINLFQQIDEELTHKLLKYFIILNDKNTFTE